jgi:Mg/Co/Ni transporter MgtE
MITDRDIAVRAVAARMGPDTPIREVMTTEVKYCFDDEDLDHVAANMAELRVRRLPVVDRSGTLVGLLAADDVLGLLGEEVSTLAAVVERGMRREGAERRAEARQVP